MVAIREEETIEEIVAHSDFRVLTTMNPGGDFGKENSLQHSGIVSLKYTRSYNCLIPKRSKTSFQRKWAVLFKQEDFQKYL
jgi:hypothetical protein